MPEMTCGFVGLGLIGGSIAKALKACSPDIRIVAYDINKEAVKLACSEGIADEAADGINRSFSPCDYIFLCAPVRKNDENLTALKGLLSPGCILTDVGSVKTSIHEAVALAGLESCFIGGHPMAGSERIGYVNSRAALLENAYYILTPTPLVPQEKVERLRLLVEKMNALPLILKPSMHDYVTAAVSHLPHVAAASLVNLIEESDSDDGIMRMVAAGGFKDITRIASSSSVMWQQICLTNGENISALLSRYINALTEFKDAIDKKDADELYRLFNSARIYRDSFANASSGPIKRSYSISVDIADRAGALAHIVALLAQHDLNIKNIAISHNRESEDGVLRVEFYREDSMEKGLELLSREGYQVHLRD